MRIGIIRGDLPGPVFLADLESVSQFNPPTEPKGQTLYISRPTAAEVEAALANATTGAGAVVQGSDISGSFPLTINGANTTLKFKTSAAAAFTTVTVAQAVYATFATFLVAVKAAVAGKPVTVVQGPGSGTRLAFESTTKGITSYLEFDTTGNGSTGNAANGISTTGVVRTMPTGATFIVGLNPVGGTLNVSTATINAIGASTSANALSLIPTNRGTQTAIAEAIAPKLTETAAVIDSFLYGSISQLKNAAYNPDSRRVPALPSSAAISVVQDDGSTAYTATGPTVSSATLGSPTTGYITIAGTGLGTSEKNETTVKLTGAVKKTILQAILVAAGGSVSSTAIVIPASLIPGATTVTTSVQVKVRHRASSVRAVA